MAFLCELKAVKKFSLIYFISLEALSIAYYLRKKENYFYSYRPIFSPFMYVKYTQMYILLKVSYHEKIQWKTAFDYCKSSLGKSPTKIKHKEI